MTWRTHRGEVEWVRDLLVINLRPPGSPEGTRADSHLHVYETHYCPRSGPGRFAYLRVDGSPNLEIRSGLTLTDTPAVTEYIRRRFRTAGVTEFNIDSAPVDATFSRSVTGDRLKLDIEAQGIRVEAEWVGLGAARFSEGASFNYQGEHVWSLVREAADAHLTVNGVSAEGSNYPDERFRIMYNRTMSACHVATGEIIIRRSS
jgi:hypothetical protein